MYGCTSVETDGETGAIQVTASALFVSCQLSLPEESDLAHYTVVMNSATILINQDFPRVPDFRDQTLCLLCCFSGTFDSQHFPVHIV